MTRKSAGKAIGVIMACCILLLAGAGYYIGTRSFMETAGAVASEQAAALLPVRVDIGRIRVDSLHSLTAMDVVVYDRTDVRMAEAESVEVDFSLLSVFAKSPAGAIKEIAVHRPKVILEQRSDGGWNYEDLVSENGKKSDFSGKVHIADGALTGRMAGKELQLEGVQASLDFAQQPAVQIKGEAHRQGASVGFSGSLGGERQTLSVDGKDFALEDYLIFLPQDLLPEGLEVQSGNLVKLSAAFVRTGDTMTYSGQAEFGQGKVRVMDTDITDIQGLLLFNEKELSVFASAVSEEQQASVHGKIRLDTGSPYLQLIVESQSFDPSRILKNIPYRGAAAFTANVSGTVDQPRVDGELRAAQGQVYGYAFQNAKAKVHYEDNNVSVRDFSAQVFSGRVEGEADFSAQDTSYTGHIKAFDLAAEELSDFLPGVSGRLTADLALVGKGNDFDALQVYGSASGQQIGYEGVTFPSFTGSFYLQGPVLRLDALNLVLPGDGRLSVEGSIMNRRQMDLAFYGGHVDLSLLQNFVPQADVTGFADFTGEVHGDLANPDVQLEMTALHGKLFQQPYEKLETTVHGSLDGIGVDHFSLQNDGKETWMVQGQVGFAGEKRVQLQIDTTGARMEDIAALVAPDQPITGNVDNIITISGTLDNPEAVGYIHFYRGSYRGVILSGMDGDYTIKNRLLTLHDFHIYSTFVDMDLNGTIDEQRNLALQVAAHDIQVDRVGRKLPYEVSGHGKFDGQISGTLDAPLFNGKLIAPQLVINEQEVHDAQGTVRYSGHNIYMEDFRFEQNGGVYTLTTSANTATMALHGKMDVKNGDINALMAMFDLKNDIVNGRLNGQIQLDGTVSNPRAHLTGSVSKGDIKGYAIQNVLLDMQLEDHVVTINSFRGEQGKLGVFAAKGSVDLAGPIEARFSAQNIEAGVFTKAAGLNADAHGMINMDAQLSGTMENPAADVSLDVQGGGIGSASFDSLSGLFNLRNGIIQVNQLILQRQAEKNLYRASAYGSVPLRAITAASDEELDEYEQFNLQVSIDQADLSLLPFLSKGVDWAVGETDGSLKITGTASHPLLNGQLGLKNGALKLKALRQPFTDMNADIQFAGDQIQVRDVSGKLGQGTYKLAGATHLQGRSFAGYDFSLQADQLEVDCSFYKGPLTGSLRLQEGEFFGKVLPKLSGAIEIANATVSVPTIPDSSGELPGLLLDVDLKLGKKVHFYSPFLYDMRLAGSAHFGGTTRHPKTSGTISVLRGTVNYLKTIFTIREGEAYFNQVNSFLPSIVFRADTKLSKARVYLAIDGPLEQMDFHMTSTPEMSETEIMQLLTLRSSYQSGQSPDQDFSSLLSVGLQMSFLSEVEGAVRNALSLDEFTIGRDTTTKGIKSSDNSMREVYNIEMGKYVSEKIMLKYTQGIGTETRRYGIQYDFNDRMSLTTQRNQDNATIVGIEARFKF